ncbi:ABC transporter substrate-binding protein [Brevibacillus sp. SYSU BS000544]|uniref:ABC transporter substrate-binding protein n=1 Tax=Brevibacillus sp. SYSU BS000544 TaxID=3416443 RepID=UPI003CE59018
MKKRNTPFAFCLSMVLLLAGLLTGCGTANQTATTPSTQAANSTNSQAEVAPRMIKHELGETEIKGKPQRIVVMEFSYADALVSLGVQPVGVADDNDPNLIIAPVKEKLGQYTSVGSRYEPNMEVISSLNPDLIIADLNHHKAVYDKLKQIAPTIVLDDHQADYQHMLTNYPIIADAVGMKEEGNKRLNEHNEKMKQLMAKLPSGETRKVLPAVVNSKGFFGHSSSSYSGSLMESLGLKNSITSDESYPKVSLEQLVELNPDVLFLMKAGEKTIVDEWKSNPLWQKLKAVQANQVFEVSRNTWALSRGLIGSEMSSEEAINLLYGKK